MIRLALVAGLVAVAIAGCAATHRTLTAHGAGTGEVTVDDGTGWAVGAFMVEPVTARDLGEWGGPVDVRNLDDTVLLIDWIGGICKEPTTVHVSGTQDALAIQVDIPKPCLLQAGLTKELRLTFDRAVNSADVTASETFAPPD